MSRCIVVEGVIEIPGFRVPYRVHLCVTGRLAHGGQVRAMEVMVDSASLAGDFFLWLSDGDHEEHLATQIAWDALEQFSRERLNNVTSLVASSRFIGRN
jgi:hypothetical protein